MVMHVDELRWQMNHKLRSDDRCIVCKIALVKQLTR